MVVSATGVSASGLSKVRCDEELKFNVRKSRVCEKGALHERR